MEEASEHEDEKRSGAENEEEGSVENSLQNGNAECEETILADDISSSSLEIQEAKKLSDANIKANDAAANLKLKLRSLSPSKRKSESDDKGKRKSSRGRRISQMMSGASFKSKCALFKKIFKDLPEEEILIVDYSCALQRDILVHGRIYLSQNWMCFYANIFGWETLVTINWHEITAITKEKTARVIPNAIRISTSRERYFFTSFVSRDNSYTALFRVWQNALLGQPSNPVELRRLCRRFRKRTSDDVDGLHDDKDETGDEVTENDNENQSVSPSDISQDLPSDQNARTRISVIPPTPPVGINEDSIWLGEHENSDVDKHEESVGGPKGDDDVEASDVSSRSASPILRRAENLLAFATRKKKQRKKLKKTYSLLPAPESPAPEGSENDKMDESSSDDNDTAKDAGGEVFCPCVGAHPGTEYCVEEFDFDVDALFEHMFSSDSDVMKQIHESRKMLNVKYHDIVKSEDGSSERLLTYTLTLNYTIGPKHSETTCKQIFHKDNTPGSFYVIQTEVFNKGIPYAESFHIFSLYCLTRLPGNRCKMRIHSEVRYTKSVMGIAKNMIQRNADQAFNDYFKNLALVLREKSQTIPADVKKKRKRPATRQTSKEDVLFAKKNGIKKSSPVKSNDFDQNSNLPLSIQNTKVPETAISKLSEGWSPKLVLGLALLLILLLIVNSYLFYRVFQLEKFAAFERKHNCVPKNLPVSDENWYKLLQTQKHTHELEVKRLKDVIGGTVLLIKQVETSIKDLYDELDKGFKEKLKNR